MFANKSGRPRAFVGRLVTSGISPPFLCLWFSLAKYCFFKRRAVVSGTVKCRDAFIGPCSAACLRMILGRVCGVVFFFARLGAGLGLSCANRGSTLWRAIPGLPRVLRDFSLFVVVKRWIAKSLKGTFLASFWRVRT